MMDGSDIITVQDVAIKNGATNSNAVLNVIQKWRTKTNEDKKETCNKSVCSKWMCINVCRSLRC